MIVVRKIAEKVAGVYSKWDYAWSKPMDQYTEELAWD